MDIDTAMKNTLDNNAIRRIINPNDPLTTKHMKAKRMVKNTQMAVSDQMRILTSSCVQSSEDIDTIFNLFTVKE